jgi:hypothetical protein
MFVPLLGLALIAQPPLPGSPVSPGSVRRPRLDPRARQDARPDPEPAAPRDRFVYPENADIVRALADGRMVAEGNIRVRTQGNTVTCDRAIFDENRKQAIFEGRVVLTTDQQTVYAERVVLFTDTRDFEATDARTIVPPELAGQGLVEPLLLSGRSLARKGGILTARDGLLTTCDLPNPHYRIGFALATLIPRQKLVVRNATFFRYDHPLARIRRFEVPIRDEIRTTYLPLIGRTNEEGFFIKSVVGYSLSQVLPGLLRVDLMEKKGIGLGFDQAYRIGDNAAGKAVFYRLADRNRGVENLNGHVEHEQRLGEVDARLSSDFQNNSYQAISSGSRTQNSTLTLARAVGASSTGINLNLSQSQFSGSINRTTSVNLTQTQRISERGTVTLRLNGTDASNAFGTSSTARSEQNGDLKVSTPVGSFDLDLSANKLLAARQTGSSGGGFSGTQRLPDLLLTTDSRRLGGALRRLPARFSLGYGKFLESAFVGGVTQPIQTDRLLFGLDLQNTMVPLTRGGRLSLGLGGSFKQTVYDGGEAAQYQLVHSSSLTQRLSESSTFSLNYNYLRPYGGLPVGFRLDQSGSNNIASTNLSIREGRTTLSFLTGFDIQRAHARVSAGQKRRPWQNASLQLGLVPSGWFATRFTSAYDINTGRLLDLTNRIRIRARSGFALDTSARYDPTAKKLAQIAEQLFAPLGSQARLSAYVDYNGLTRRFTYRSFAFTQSFHDYEMTVSFIDQPFGFRSEKGVSLSFRLKAFAAPVESSAGRYGTALSTGIGEVY